mmetsp:Transcript_28578/g.47276  ORF Transcript_28578/g.47276 Transcript_28578/m.47276 type:complete len:651 (+) Transcript_28578:16-1968(+)
MAGQEHCHLIQGRPLDLRTPIDEGGGGTRLRRRSGLAVATVAAVLTFCLAYFLPASHLLSKTPSSVATKVTKGLSALDSTNGLNSSGLPHIVFFLIDDQGYDDMGYSATSNDYIPLFTPTLDAYAADGVKLSMYYSDLLCTPSRASIMTGKNLLHNGMQHGNPSVGYPYALPLEHTLMPQYMKGAGYNTYMIGKWNLGDFNRAYLPTRRGFDDFVGYLGSQISYYGHYAVINGRKYYDMHQNEAPLATSYGTMDFEVFDNRAKQVIREYDTSKPMFLYYATHGIHGSYSQPPAKYLTDEQVNASIEVYDKTNSTQRKLLTLNLATVDRTFANLVTYLKEKDMYDNTLIVVASDNGGCSNEMGSSYPLRGQKYTLFEGGVRVNAFVTGGYLPESTRGRSLDCMFHNVDWLPTLVAGAVGADPEALGPLDGVNHWDDLVMGMDATPQCYRDEMVHTVEVGVDASAPYEKGVSYSATDTLRAGLRMGDYKLVYGEQEIGWWSDTEFSAACSSSGMCGGNSTGYVPFGYVFNIAKDFTEHHNLIDIVDDTILSKLWQRLDYYFENMANPGWRWYDVSEVALATYQQNDDWVRPWISDEDLESPRDAFQKEMVANNTVKIDGQGHDHPDRPDDPANTSSSDDDDTDSSDSYSYSF